MNSANTQITFFRINISVILLSQFISSLLKPQTFRPFCISRHYLSLLDHSLKTWITRRAWITVTPGTPGLGSLTRLGSLPRLDHSPVLDHCQAWITRPWITCSLGSLFTLQGLDHRKYSGASEHSSIHTRIEIHIRKSLGFVCGYANLNCISAQIFWGRDDEGGLRNGLSSLDGGGTGFVENHLCA